MKYTIVASKKDPAGMNIVSELEKLNCKIPIHLVEEEIIHAEKVDEKLDADFIIFASKHRAVKNEKALTVHTIGNFKKAEYGGKSETLSPSSASITKTFFQTLNKNNDSDYKVTLEATHHGPLLKTPSLFIEIGATKEEWVDKKAGKIVAKTIIEATKNKLSKSKPAFGIGGPHYCPNFNEIQLSSDYAISFVVAKYSLPLTENLIKQLIDKTIEKPKTAIVDWKGFDNSTQRNHTIELLKSLEIEIVKSRDAKNNH